MITSTIRVPDRLEGGPGRAFYVQDGGYPETINWIMEAGDQPAALVRAARFVKRLLRLWLRKGGSSDIGADLSRLIGSDPISSTTLPLFSMGRDIPDGTMRLTDDGLLERRLEQAALEPDLRGRAPHRPRHRAGARREVRGQPAVVRRAASSPCIRSAAARWVHDAARRGRRLLRAGLRLPGLRHRRRLGDARPRRPEPLEHDLPRSLTASPSG